MQAPMTIRFATDHSAAKSGIQDLAASVLSNMVKVSDAMNTGIQANGGYVNTVRTLAANVGSDFAKVGAAGLKAANDSNYSVVATADAVARAAASTKTAGMAASGAWAVSSEAAKANLSVVRNEVAATARVIATSPLIVSAAGAVAGFFAARLALDFYLAGARAASEALEGMAKAGDKAAKLGVSTTFLQTYSAQARTLRVDVEDLVKSLEMAKSAFTVKQAEGGADARHQSSFEARLRQQAEAGNVTTRQVDRFTAAQGTEAQFRVALDLIAELQGKGRELAALDLAGRIFPSEIVERIRAGTIEIDKLRKTMDDVRNPDLVLLKPEEIARAQELQRRLEDAEAVLAKAGKEFDQYMIRAGMTLKEDAIAWKELMGSAATWFLSQMKQARGYMDAQDKVEPAIYGRDYFRPQDAPASGLRKDVGAPAAPKSTGDPEMDAALNKLRGNLGNRPLIDQAQAAARKMGDGLQPDQTKPIVTSKPSPKTASESLDAVDTFINGLEKTAAATKAEAEAFHLSNAEKAVAIQLAKLKETADQNGITVTEEQTTKVRAAAAATAEYRDRLQDLEQAQQQAAETARYFGGALSSGFADAILEGKSLGNVLLDLEKQLARAALHAVFTGQGPLAGFLGMAPAASAGSSSVGGLAGFASSLFGSGAASANAPLPGAQGPTMESGIGSIFSGLFRANGGPVRAGQAYTVGELGQEIFVPGQDGAIVPIGRGGGTGGAPPLNFIDQRPAGSADLSPTTRRNADGGTDILLRQLDGGLSQRGRRGQGSLSGVLNTAGSRKG